MPILTPETGHPYISHVIVSFGIRPYAFVRGTRLAEPLPGCGTAFRL